ncbi:MAG: hypothetical protein IH891_05320 [Planctomycetes bacterium]|nr:hypothetical protein [Planctomycetota bacterium]
MNWRSPIFFLALQPPAPEQVRLAVVLFEVFVVLMGLFLLVITLQMLRRMMRRRWPSRKKEDSKPMPDPWQEAGERLKP